MIRLFCLFFTLALAIFVFAVWKTGFSSVYLFLNTSNKQKKKKHIFFSWILFKFCLNSKRTYGSLSLCIEPLIYFSFYFNLYNTENFKVDFENGIVFKSFKINKIKDKSKVKKEKTEIWNVGELRRHINDKNCLKLTILIRGWANKHDQINVFVKYFCLQLTSFN